MDKLINRNKRSGVLSSSKDWLFWKIVLVWLITFFFQNCYSLTKEFYFSNEQYANFANEFYTTVKNCSFKKQRGVYKVLSRDGKSFYSLDVSNVLEGENRMLSVLITLAEDDYNRIIVTIDENNRDLGIEKNIEVTVILPKCMQKFSETTVIAEDKSFEIYFYIVGGSGGSGPRLEGGKLYLSIDERDKTNIRWINRNRAWYVIRHLGYLVTIPADFIVVPVSGIYYIYKFYNFQWVG